MNSDVDATSATCEAGDGHRRLFLKLFLVWLAVNVVVWFAPGLWESGQQTLANWRIAQMASHYETRGVALAEQAKATLPYLFFRPTLKANEKAPLIVVLHGSGERGNDCRAQLRTVGTFLVEPSFQSSQPCFVMAPQCPENLRWQSSGPIDVKGAFGGIIDEVVLTEAVDVSRIYLMGYSMGAFGCWHYLSETPDRFAGCIAVAGGGDPDAAAAVARTPVWAIHGKNDVVVPAESSREMVDAVIAAGGHAKLTILEKVGHGSFQVVKRTPNPYLKWLLQQRRIEGPGDEKS
ncbi:MAG: alpha/beta fold hydrolase [Planctomycetota bacterium]